MMKRLRIALMAIVFTICVTCSGVYASWHYIGNAESADQNVSLAVKDFVYPPFYITNIGQASGNYASAATKKTGDTNIQANLTLNAAASSSATLDVTFYNNTDVSYYYKETQTVSSSNAGISYVVSGVEQREEVPAKTYKTLTVTYSFADGVTANTSLVSDLHFSFVVDKDSIGIVVAQSAVTQFEDILNGRSDPESYQTLKNYMNNRGSNSSSVSYVGNVAGANDNDSQLIQELFTNEFLTMDLDGDGEAEPITLMIKRENLDGDTSTGDSYTYRALLGGNRTVNGAEFTLYITSEGFDQRTLNVYAVTYTKLEGSDEWIQVVPLTKGTADANRYSFGFGGNNSFNTDTWEDESGNTMDTLTRNAMKNLQ